MDLNDPRRRLQVAKASNPSLRMATASKEQPKISGVGKASPRINYSAPEPSGPLNVAQAPQFVVPKISHPIRVGQAPTQPTLSRTVAGAAPSPIVKEPSFLEKVAATAKSVTSPQALLNFTAAANQKFLGGVISSGARFANYIGSGGDGHDTEDRTKDFMKSLHLEENNNALTAGTDKNSGAFKAGEVAGNVERAGAEIGAALIPGVAVEKGLTSVLKAKGILQGTSTLTGIGRNAGPAVVGGYVSSLINQAQNPTQDAAMNIGGGAAIDTAIAVAGPAASAIVRVAKEANLGAKFIQRLETIFSSANADDLAKEIVKETDPDVIKASLNVDDVTAQYLTSETSPESVKEVLKSLSVDPEIDLPAEVRQKLEAEGITAVKKQDNPYGAEYNPNDRSISVRSQADATDANIYHELGHDIYVNKLTPEEKALFKDVNGPGRAQAAKRPGYSEYDMISEDFSDMMRTALTDGIENVPEKYRAVIAKYAGIAVDKLAAGDVADTVLHIPGVGHSKITKSQADILKDEVNNIPWTTNDRPHLTAGEKVKTTTKELTPEELAQASPNAASALERADAKIAAQAEATGKAQTGTSESTFVKSADEFSPDAAPGDKQAIQQVLDELNGAESAYKSKQAIVSTEKGQRINKAAGSFDAAGGGEAGFRAKLGSLKGKYTDSNYEPISVDPQVEDTLINAIEGSQLRDFEKLNTQNALRKVWGANPDKPTQSDITYIRKFFNEHYGEGTGDEMAKGIEEALTNTDKSYQDTLVEIAGLPRALMATGDLSGGFRQAAPLGTRFPKIWANANKESVKYAMNPKYYEQEMQKIADAPDYTVITDKMGVDLTGVGAMQDEAFIGAGLAEKIPVGGHVVKGADRAYTGVLTRMRYDVASKIVKDAGGPDAFLRDMQELYGDAKGAKGLFSGSTNKADRAMRSFGEVVNTLTGRGGMKGGVLDQHMKTASTLLFAPRLWAANLQRLNPVWYAKLYRDNPQAAKLAAQSAGTFYSMAGAMLGLAMTAGAAVGAEVGLDARSADFLKIKLGNTRYDILGGQQQNLVQIARQITGEKVNSETGEVTKLGEGFGQKNRLDIFADMVNNKANPLLGFILGISRTKATDNANPLIREDEYGNEYNVADKVARLFIPLGVQGAFDTSVDVGNPVKGIALNSPSVLGVGVQTYGNQKTADFTKKDGKKEYTGKIEDNMVLDSSGKPILDDKGKVVTVDFPKDATDLEKKAMIDDKRDSALSAQFKNNLSREDQALLKLSDEQISKYVKDGTITQDQADHVERLKKGAQDWGKEIDVPEGANSEVSQNFYKKYNSMTKKDQDYWLKQKPEQNSKEISKLVNKERIKGLPEFKASNQLAKLYADYEKSINTTEGLTATDKQEKAKEFQKEALKLNYSESQRDIYASSITNLRTLIDSGKISKKDLDKAIELDNYAVASGLAYKSKFSKGFRGDYGYAAAPGGSGGGSGGGGRSGSSSKRGYLSALLPSLKLNGGGNSKPTFSEKRRTKGISFKDVSTPKKSNSKKVTINL